MTKEAKYIIAQYVEDPFRREPRNVGVLVNVAGSMAARFVGETEPGTIDGRKLRLIRHPEVYRQWVEYWRTAVSNKYDWAELIKDNGSHYRVVDGGAVSDIADDSPASVADYLYSMLISEGGFAEALGIAADEPDAGLARLKEDVISSLSAARVIAEEGLEFGPRHPVRRNRNIEGTAAPHRPALVQENGQLYVMETIDLSDRSKTRVRDHAGSTAYMFDDIRKVRLGKVHAISIVRSIPATIESEDVEYAMKVLKKESDELVNWADATEREKFVADRVAVAA